MVNDSGNWFLLGGLGIIVLWLLAISYLLARAIKHYNRLVAGSEGKNLANVLEEILNSLRQGKEEAKSLREDLIRLGNEGVSHIQKIGFVRFNPFSDTGGDQSFVLALLDGENSGMVITGLHSRDSTRIYGKPVKKGKSQEYEFSKEEEEAIKKAMSSKRK